MAYQTTNPSSDSDVIQSSDDALDLRIRAIQDIPIDTTGVQDGQVLTYEAGTPGDLSFINPPEISFYLPVISGRYYDTSYMLSLGALQARTVPDDILICVPFFAPYDIDIDRIKVAPTVTDATSQLRFGLYEDSGSYPGDLIAQSPATNFTQYDTFFSSTRTLSRGIYWLAFVHNRTSTTQFYAYNLTGNRGILGFPDVSTAPNNFKGMVYATALTFGALPDPFTASVSPDVAQYLPSIGVRIA